MTGAQSRRATGPSGNRTQAVRDSVLERHWMSAAGKRWPRVILHSKVNEVLAEMLEAHPENILELTRPSTRVDKITIICM